MQTREDRLQSFGGNTSGTRVGLLPQLGLASPWTVRMAKPGLQSPSSHGKQVPALIKSVSPDPL